MQSFFSILLNKAKQQFRSPRFKRHQKSSGHLASQTYIVRLIFPLLSAFLAILQTTSKPYSIRHSDLAYEKFSFNSTLNFLPPCLFAKLNIMKIVDFCSHPFCCVIPLNYLFGCLTVPWSVRSRTVPFICSWKTAIE